MCDPMLNQTRQNYSTATENMAFECNKSFSGATTNLRQENPCMTSGIHIRYHFSLYHLLFTASGVSYCICLPVRYY